MSMKRIWLILLATLCATGLSMADSPRLSVASTVRPRAGIAPARPLTMIVRLDEASLAMLLKVRPVVGGHGELPAKETARK